MDKIEIEFYPCLKCKLPVKTEWVIKPDGANAGMLSTNDNVLVGDCVFHPKCWEEIEADYFGPLA